MTKIYHKKLIRDKIPEIIEADGNKYELRVMGESEFRKELRNKLIEESKEVIEAEKGELIKELADVLEVIKSIAEDEDMSFKLIEEKQKQRREKRGSFKKRLFLIWSDKATGK